MSESFRGNTCHWNRTCLHSSKWSEIRCLFRALMCWYFFPQNRHLIVPSFLVPSIWSTVWSNWDVADDRFRPNLLPWEIIFGLFRFDDSGSIFSWDSDGSVFVRLSVGWKRKIKTGLRTVIRTPQEVLWNMACKIKKSFIKKKGRKEEKKKKNPVRKAQSGKPSW